jgi:uncharacterized protein DUF397
MRHQPTFSIGMFRKARASGVNTNCVHIARHAGWVVIRNSKNSIASAGGDPQLWFTEAQFDGFQSGVRTARMDGHDLVIDRCSDGTYVFRNVNPQADRPRLALIFTEGEYQAFLAGVVEHEFDQATPHCLCRA